eukprot:1151981-Pelagomonas_calceolata.AAC.6
MSRLQPQTEALRARAYKNAYSLSEWVATLQVCALNFRPPPTAALIMNNSVTCSLSISPAHTCNHRGSHVFSAGRSQDGPHTELCAASALAGGRCGALAG